MDDFASVIQTRITEPLLEICRLLSEEEATEELFYFSGVLSMFNNPEEEELVISGCIELSRCAFLGFTYSHEVQTRINELLDRAIDISHTMTATDKN